MKHRIILASTSPRRAALLKQIGISFVVIASNFEEVTQIKNPTIRSVKQMITTNAKGKALAVAKTQQGMIIGVDTVVFYHGELIGKPKDNKDALRILKMLNGTKHKILSAIAVVKNNQKEQRVITDCVVSEVSMRKASEKELQEYVQTGEPLDKAGAYGVQERGAIFIKHIHGDYYNIVGLPLVKLLEMCKKLGVDLLTL